MLTHPTLDKLQSLRLSGMYQALMEQMNMPDIGDLNFEERLGLLVDRELTERDDRRLKTRLHKAKLRQAACIEDIDYRHPRGLDKALMLRLATCQWVREHHNLLITGPTGWRVPWATKRAATAIASSTCGCPDSCKRCPRRRAMGGMPKSWRLWPKPI